MESSMSGSDFKWDIFAIGDLEEKDVNGGEEGGCRRR